MDIVTHAMMGLIGAGPLLVTHPLAGAAFAFGSVVPDLDALSRLAGKRAFLACHQTYTHSVPLIAAAGFIAWMIEHRVGLAGSGIALGLIAGMTLHSVLDWTNTLGIALLSPFRARRYCLEWVFFLDAFVLTATLTALGMQIYLFARGRVPSWHVTLVYAGAMLLYWLAKGAMRYRAGRLAPAGTCALLPSAIVPWRFLGCRQSGEQAVLFRLDALSGKHSDYAQYSIRDAEYQTVLDLVPEFALMRHLSPAYHLVDVESQLDGVRLFCRDLRTRNFGTRYGDLEIQLDQTGAIAEVQFHVREIEIGNRDPRQFLEAVMKEPLPPRRTYGFRLSRTDVVVLVLAAAGAIYLWPRSTLFAGLILTVVGHFFLFCNVVRLHRNFELIWAAIFVVNATVWWGLLADLRVWPALLTQLPVTLLLIAIQIRSPMYRGIGARWLNPRLQEALSSPR